MAKDSADKSNVTPQGREAESSLKKVIAHAKEYGFVYPSSEIYDGLQAVYDYGPFGVELKNNLKQAWWQAMTRLNDNIVGLDAAIFMQPQTWKASGHVDSFNDPMIDNKDSKKRYRADNLIEDYAARLEAEGEIKTAYLLLKKMNSLLEAEDLVGLRELIVEYDIRCPLSDTANWTDVRQFNLMFSTKVGSVTEDSNTIYLRPETAQGIFVNFLNVQKTARQKVPFGIAQIGKAFRNEIVARQFIFRMREFEQMEMQFFVRPGEEMQWFDHWKSIRIKWHEALGLEPEKLRIHEHEKLAHYANAAIDIEYLFPFGFKEVEGIHSRTDFDLKSHQEVSGKKMQYFDPEVGKNYIPYVIETSIGADRLFLMMMCEAYTEDTGVDAKGNEKTRIYLKIHPALAPVKAAILPLVKKDGLPEIATSIYEDLKMDLKVTYDESAAIGKRYTRQDLIGTPFCIAVDHQSKEDNTVTIRHRDSTEQERIAIPELKSRLLEATSMKHIFEKLA
ncbi:glycyl-tRNA synthetase [Catalinimonas alkaloidigena]|uniref:glycine--tRNA ligase n=1 Tax=Catalinimonas alkaloidigena TaxID=1075417 RepID=UPI00240750AA|nr:glycine--tRNA ligase [Catalinimonas alkaloidigena]MDF9800001.1 glycyl-tRNA synthetase [Catalinimonas alkaloidigena]